MPFSAGSRGGDFIGTLTFDATDIYDVGRAFRDAQTSAQLGHLNTAAADAVVGIEVGVQVAAVFIPGPQEFIVSAAIGKALQKLAPLAIEATYVGGKWVFKRAGAILKGKAADAVEAKFRAEVIKELGGEAVQLATGRKYPKHLPPNKGMWSATVKSTAKGYAKYRPDIDIEIYERGVWKHGTPLQHKNGQWKVMEFDHEIGACTGKPSRWMRVEGTQLGNVTEIHGHPISQEEYRKLLKRG